jgi:hypothetical protein
MTPVITPEQPKNEPPLAPLYKFVVNLNERGSFSASVYDAEDNSVYELRGGDELGEDESSLVDDGFIRSFEDLDGLAKYLQSIGIIPANTRVLKEREFEEALDAHYEEWLRTNRRSLLILASPNTALEDLDEEDDHVPGVYQVSVDPDVPEEDLADTALDIFHDNIAVEVLDDFDFCVVDPETNELLSQNDDYESYSGTHNGVFDEKIDTDVDRYMPVQESDSDLAGGPSL